METSTWKIWEELVPLLTSYALDAVGAIVILVVGLWLARRVQGGVRRVLGRTPRVDETLRAFVASLARYLVIVFTGFAVLSQVGIQTASLLAVFGAAGLAVGLALQGTLSNVAAGVMLLIFRPFKIGDYVEAAGLAGTVKAVTLFSTELASPDNVQIIAPNSLVWGTVVKNYSHHATRRADLVVGIGYGDDIDKAMQAVAELLAAEPRALADPQPTIAVAELGDSAVTLAVRVWCAAGDYGSLKFDLPKAIKERFDAGGISIPYPQRTVHLVSAAE